MPPRPHPLTRRTTLALAGLGLVALAGCDDRDQPSPGAGASPSADPDAALVETVVAAQGNAWRRARQSRALDLVAVHEAHLEALDATVPTTSAQRMPRLPLRQTEVQLQRLLVDSATSAQSGALASLLASMSAAIGQQLEVL